MGRAGCRFQGKRSGHESHFNGGIRAQKVHIALRCGDAGKLFESVGIEPELFSVPLRDGSRGAFFIHMGGFVVNEYPCAVLDEAAIYDPLEHYGSA